MSNPNYNKKTRNIVVIVVAVVLLIFIFMGEGTPLENLKSIGDKITDVTDDINDSLEEPKEKNVISTEMENPTVQVHMIDVGQGDSTLIRTPKADILIDGGEYKYYADLAKYLNDLGIEKLDYIIATHPHADHIGSLSEIVNNFQVDRVLFPEIPESLVPTTRSFTNLLEAIDEKNVDLYTVEPGTEYSFGEDVKMKILGPVGNMENLNNISIITKLTCGDVSFLFTGDAEKDAEKALIDTGEDLHADVYSAGHHGSNTSNKMEFLKAVSPEIVLVSCGADNSYGHPHKEVMERFKKLGVTVYRTDLDGSVVVETDGKEIAVVCENERGDLVA